ncbi:zf-HC2 domain-containing protein [Actinacidiphila acididurans]|uniref:Zf-HC2 domain-containing protein n=1 Tax=Actinacidiphila acididurans TaxID=2784346 RepID=A0ABS2TSL9_9ACTN|nr:zf-HC2 domain-containing protein [Actinacidiphila acididurans]MBM9506334.1 zf-HC2 domain-containing protein [Actinacidiphila acididurans]
MSSAQDGFAELLAPYVLGALDEDDQREVDAHAASCDECRKELAELREMEAMLGTVPPEAFLDGPPDDADLLLQRTLRQVRDERTADRRRRSLTLGAAVAASAAAVFLGGYLAGGGSSDSQAAPAPPPTTTGAPVTATPPAGVRAVSATDPVTGARLTLRMTPAAGWVRLNAAVTGIPAGERCRLVVVDRSGHREVAGSWVVGRAPSGGGKGADLDGSAATAAQDIASVAVENDHGKTYVSASV